MSTTYDTYHMTTVTAKDKRTGKIWILNATDRIAPPTSLTEEIGPDMYIVAGQIQGMWDICMTVGDQHFYNLDVLTVTHTYYLKELSGEQDNYGDVYDDTHY
jgi:hypothetical protein